MTTCPHLGTWQGGWPRPLLGTQMLQAFVFSPLFTATSLQRPDRGFAHSRCLSNTKERRESRKLDLFSSLCRLAAMKGRDLAHIFLDMRIHRPTKVQTHRPTNPHIYQLADTFTHSPTDLKARRPTHSHIHRDPWMSENRPTDHTLPAPWAVSGPPAEPHARLLQARRIEGTSQEYLLGTCGKKRLCRKEPEGGERSERSKGKGRPKEAGSQKRRGDGEEGRRAMHPLLPPPRLAACLSRHSFEHTDWASGEQGSPGGNGTNQGASREPVVTLCAFRSCQGREPLECWGGTERGPEADFPEEPYLGHRVRGQRQLWRGTGGGES